MPKKSSSSKTSANMLQNPLVEDQMPSVKPKKLRNEIDEIFGGKKRKKPEGKKTSKSSEEVKSVEPKRKKEKKSKGAMEGDFADAAGQSRKRTEGGLSIYTEEELGINNADAGNTPLCPFDCSCCF
ncbi:hypothetical protein ACOSQ2_009746 [Xanthoceras sorbifolium]